ncbi:MAG TPA: OmpA family protein [Stellaceae bacterium]|nr:OmpA family protein [Stellaceae bacterium]
MLRPLLYVAALATLAACMPMAGPGANDAGRFLVYFDEFSANLTPEAKKVVADAVAQAKATQAHGVRIEARASATGSPQANQPLAQTRSQVVADELAKDGLNPATFSQVSVGQTGSGDPSVADRRVDIVLLR